MLAGARAAWHTASTAHPTAGEDAEFMRNKIAVARFSAEHVLTRVPGLRDSVVDGAAVNDVGGEGF